MHQPTALHRASTVVVAALFAVVFVCSGVASAQTQAAQGETAVSGNTTVSKAAVRTAPHTSKSHQNTPEQHFDLISTGPVNDNAAPPSVVAAVGNEPALRSGTSTISASDRAPPTR